MSIAGPSLVNGHHSHHNGGGILTNGMNGGMDHHVDLKSLPSEVLEAELPFVQDEQVPLSEILSRVVQDIYAELMTLADTLPSSSDATRKRLLADFVIKHKKQVVKTFAVVRWAKDARDVQKCMNITAFLMNQNAQFMDAANAITLVKDSYAAEKLRNHDLLTSLDVLTTGTYQRLPTAIKKLIISPKQLTNEQIERTLKAFDHLIRYRLRMNEIVPVEMCSYTVSSGQVRFHVPNLFSASVSLRDSEDNSPWFLVDVEFDIKIGGDDTGVVAFPRSPTGITKQYIVEEADLRLARYAIPPEPEPPQAPEQPKEGEQAAAQVPSRPTLPENLVDAPLVRLYNFMQMMSLSYQLEILNYQAQRMRSLGWADYLKVLFSKDRKTLTVTYWLRKPPPPRPANSANSRVKVPLQGGTIVISIEPKPPVTKSSSPDTAKSKHPPGRSHKDRVLHELGLGMKLKRKATTTSMPTPAPPPSVEPPRTSGTRSARASVAPSPAQSVPPSVAPEEPEKYPSDEVNRLFLKVTWTPDINALGFVTNPSDFVEEYEIPSNNLDFQGLLTHAIRRHSEAVLNVFRKQLCEGQNKGVFASEDVVVCTDGDNPALQILLCADEVVLVTIDTRTGRFTLRNTGDLAAAGRGPRFANVTERINEDPVLIMKAITSFRYSTILESAEQKAIALGLQTYKQRNMSREEFLKFGPQSRAHLFIQLHNFPTHYLVLVVADEDFKHALVSVKTVVDNGTVSMVIEDIGWLDLKKVRGRVSISLLPDGEQPGIGMKRKLGETDIDGREWVPKKVNGKDKDVGMGTESFKLESDVIRELYAYCCARVSHMKVEQQLKARAIPYTHGMPSSTSNSPTGPTLTRGVPPGHLGWVHSTLASSVPVLCVQSKDILQGVPAAEAAMPNIRIVPINWWTERKCQVVTCVKLKYVQPPVGKNAGTDNGSGSGQNTVIRPSKSVIYDTQEAIVSFLSEDVNTCVDEFLDGWARVSTIVVIAREVSQMAKAKEWDDVRLLSFDLQTVEFTYTTGYALSISCINQQQNPMGGSYQLRFSRVLPDGSTRPGVSLHNDASPFLRPLLRNGRLAGALAEMVEMLRETLPLALELEKLITGPVTGKQKVDVFPKSCGWYRVLFGDLRHALDFRLMKEKRVVIMDASHSIFESRDDTEKEKEKDKKPGDIGILQPIPDFGEILRQVDPGRVSQSGVAMIDVGLVCDVNIAGKIGLQVVRKVAEKLQL
ncbi:hypothetical protein M422DRAFT_32064 [Sphaerobolus stellatus SS14]|uniref:Mediator of RNA polymerase II transcription subunit 14 n=1 Tax=Sphaerobolus stellatus (strain SS14) TaxID=990650 RepID=A0A0C9VRM0_SPHS4|nr:hypothetical protein M422DRAFT_32064 [Sphaerobolus stellatus SS14]